MFLIWSANWAALRRASGISLASILTTGMYSVTWALISPEWRAPPVQHSVLAALCRGAVLPSTDHQMSHTSPSGTAAAGGSGLHGACWYPSGRQ